MTNFYLLLKLVHILSATLLFGTGLGSAFYMWRAHRSNDTAAIAMVARNVVLADWIFTTPAVVLQPLTGFAMMWLAGYSWHAPWILGALLLYLVAAACWLPVVWLQIRIRDLAQAVHAAALPLTDDYRRHFKVWFALGWPAFIAVLLTFYLMVGKPNLW